MADEAPGTGIAPEDLVVGRQYSVAGEDGTVVFVAALASRTCFEGAARKLSFSNGAVLDPDFARFTFTEVDG